MTEALRKLVDRIQQEEKTTPEHVRLVSGFFKSFLDSVREDSPGIAQMEQAANMLAECMLDHIREPVAFENYHRSVRTPVDYYKLGLDLFRPLVDFEHSLVEGSDNLDKIQRQLDAGENVIFTANHQSELDPQVMSFLMDEKYPGLAERTVFVAGARVLTDPVAVPFSMGRNLLCIYSKRHIENPPEQKAQKLRHNQRSMQEMSRLLSEGGCCIYIALSGGRDRPNSEGQYEVAPFDPASTQMLFLTAHRAKVPTHFYPLSLWSYKILPPPSTIIAEIGEERHTAFAPLGMCVGDEVDPEVYPGSELEDKVARREARARYLWELVKTGYDQLAEELE